MKEFRLKQKKLKKIMNIFCIITAVFMFVYIGVEPFLPDIIGSVGTLCVGYAADVLVVVSVALLFVYFSKYSKSDSFLEYIEYELSDCGCYFTSRQETSQKDYLVAVLDDLKSNGFNIETNVEIDGFTFDVRAIKGKELFYIVCDDEIDKNDVIAYQQSAIYDITAVNVKRKANAVMLYICDNADDSAVSLSKAITPLGKKEQIKIANSIVELSSKRCYFLGNKPTKCQQMIANYVMNCALPIKDKFKLNENLPFQYELEEHMKDFNIKDFNNGTFFAH